MGRVKRGAILCLLMERLKEHRSWCGETHLQKAVYFSQEIAGVPMEYKFVLYRHGPFSFDLRDELTALRADGAVSLEPAGGYGPRMAITERAREIQKLFPKTLRSCKDQLEFVAKEVGGSDVMKLERLSTALYVNKKYGGKDYSVQEATEKVRELKPHISERDAMLAVEAVAEMQRRAKEAGLTAA